jgi:hypothetical protein
MLYAKEILLHAIGLPAVDWAMSWTIQVQILDGAGIVSLENVLTGSGA